MLTKNCLYLVQPKPHYLCCISSPSPLYLTQEKVNTLQLPIMKVPCRNLDPLGISNTIQRGQGNTKLGVSMPQIIPELSTPAITYYWDRPSQPIIIHLHNLKPRANLQHPLPSKVLLIRDNFLMPKFLLQL